MIPYIQEFLSHTCLWERSCEGVFGCYAPHTSIISGAPSFVPRRRGVGDPRPHQLVAPICLNEATAPTRFGMEGAPKGSAGPHASSLALTL